MNTESTVKNAALGERLAQLRPEELPVFPAENRAALITEDRPFAACMRAKINVKRSVKNSTERFEFLSSR